MKQKKVLYRETRSRRVHLTRLWGENMVVKHMSKMLSSDGYRIFFHISIRVSISCFGNLVLILNRSSNF